jgi:hypothetical protein
MEILAISYTCGLSSAHLGHGLRDRLPDFYVQVSSTNLITMSVPPAMEQPIIKKYKLKKDGRPAKKPLFLGDEGSTRQMSYTKDLGSVR